MGVNFVKMRIFSFAHNLFERNVWSPAYSLKSVLQNWLKKPAGIALLEVYLAYKVVILVQYATFYPQKLSLQPR